MPFPLSAPGGPVNLVQWNEPVSAQNNPSGQADVQNRVIEQIFSASGVDPNGVVTNFVGFTPWGHKHQVADIVDFPTNIGGSGGNSIGVIATKIALFASTGGGSSPLFMLCTEDSRIYYWNGANWTIQVDRFNQVINVASYGSFADGSVHTISSADIANHVGIWVGTYTAGIDTWDFVAWQEAIYAAFAGLSTPGTIRWNGGNTALNKALYAAPGNYVINRPLTINYTEGVYIYGAGEFSTSITSLYQVAGFGVATILQCNGFSYYRIENIQFQQSAASPAPANALIVISYDGTTSFGYNGASQGGKWINCYFNGNGQFAFNDPNFPSQMHMGYGVMISPFVSQFGAQGSETVFHSCHWIWFETGYFQDNFNALQNGFYGGNFENCRLAAIKSQEGAIRVDNVGFQNDTSGPNNSGIGGQLLWGGYDIVLTSSANDASLITNCRSQSFNFVQSASGHKVTVMGCNIDPFFNQWSAGKGYTVGNIINGTYTSGFNDGALWECTVAGTSSGSEPNWAASNGISLTDGSVTWTKSNNVPISGDYNMSVINCVIPFGQMNVQTGWVENNQFTRSDWIPFGSGWVTNPFNWRNNSVYPQLLGGGGQIKWGIGPGSKHLNPTYMGPDSALLFRRAFGEVGFDYGDQNFDIIGVYGWLGIKTPVGTDQPGGDQVIAAGMSTGAGVPGKIRLKVAAPGTTGTAPNNLSDAGIIDNTGWRIGQSASLVVRNLQQDYSCTPGTIVATAGSNFFTQTNSFYGVLPGDIVEPSFTGQALPAGVIAQATVIAADKVRFDLYNGSNASQAITAGRVRYAVMVRPAVTGVTGQSAASDIAQFQTDLGGAANFQCMYDSRVQVTGSPSITKIDDIAGSGGGKGPTLNLTGVGNPLYIFGNTLVQSNGTSSLASVSSGAFDISGTKTILFGFSFQINTSTQLVFSISNGTDQLQGFIAGNNPGPWAPALNYQNPNQLTINYPACPASNVLRFGYITLTATTLTMTIFDQGTVSQAISAYPAGNNIFTLFPIVGGNILTTLFSHFAILNVAITSDQISTYRSWGIAKHNNITV